MQQKLSYRSKSRVYEICQPDKRNGSQFEVNKQPLDLIGNKI